MPKFAASVVVLFSWVVPFVAAPAFGDHRAFIDTETLNAWCRPYALGDAGVGRLCAGYIFAIADLLTDNLSVNGRRACIPPHVTLSQLRAVVFERLENRSKDADETAHDLVVRAFAQNYPCKQ